jgi:hypothetical protein
MVSESIVVRREAGSMVRRLGHTRSRLRANRPAASTSSHTVYHTSASAAGPARIT